MQVSILQEIGITTWHKKSNVSQDVYITPYLLLPSCTVFLPFSRDYTNLQLSKIKLLTNKMLQVLNLNKQQISIISIYLNAIDSLIKEPEQKVILDYLQQSKPKQILSFLSPKANKTFTINDIAFTEIIHPEIILQNPQYKRNAYAVLLALRDKIKIKSIIN